MIGWCTICFCSWCGDEGKLKDPPDPSNLMRLLVTGTTVDWMRFLNFPMESSMSSGLMTISSSLKCTRFLFAFFFEGKDSVIPRVEIFLLCAVLYSVKFWKIMKIWRNVSNYHGNVTHINIVLIFRQSRNLIRRNILNDVLRCLWAFSQRVVSGASTEVKDTSNLNYGRLVSFESDASNESSVGWSQVGEISQIEVRVINKSGMNAGTRWMIDSKIVKLGVPSEEIALKAESIMINTEKANIPRKYLFLVNHDLLNEFVVLKCVQMQSRWWFSSPWWHLVSTRHTSRRKPI